MARLNKTGKKLQLRRQRDLLGVLIEADQLGFGPLTAPYLKAWLKEDLTERQIKHIAGQLVKQGYVESVGHRAGFRVRKTE